MWSDNVYSAPEDEEEDTSLTLSPSLSVDYVGKRGSLYLNFSASRMRYRRLERLDRDSLDASIDGSFRLSRHTTIGLTHSLSYTFDVTTQSGRYADIMSEAGIVSQLIQREVMADQLTSDVTLRLSHGFSERTSFNGWIRRYDDTFSDTAFDDSETTSLQGGLTHELNRRDTVSCTLFGKRHKFGMDEIDNRQLRMLLKYRHRHTTQVDYTLSFIVDNNVNKYPSEREEVESLMFSTEGGLLYRINPRWTFDCSVGLRNSMRKGDLTEGEDRRSMGSVFKMELRRSLRNSNLNFNLNKSFNPGVRSGFNTTFFGVDYTRYFGQDVSWTTSLTCSRNESDDETTINSKTWVISSDLTWKINDYADFSIQLSHVDQESEGEENSNVKKNTISVSLNLRYAVKR